MPPSAIRISLSAVADIWRDWPVRDAALDLVLSIFAPKNFPEAARVLRPGGVLAIAFPGPDHLIELRRAFGLLDQGEGKTETYAASMTTSVGAPRHQRLRTAARLDAADVANVILMGPNAHRTRLEDLPPEGQLGGHLRHRAADRAEEVTLRYIGSTAEQIPATLQLHQSLRSSARSIPSPRA